MGYSGRLVFHYKEWKITIDKRPNYDRKPVRIMKQLKNKSGYLITHLGKIERTDKAGFNTHEIAPLLIVFIGYYLLRVGGMWVCLLKGKRDEELVWFDNSIPIISPWKENLTWFPKQKAEVIEDLFPIVVEKFENHYLKKVLCESLSWYIECNSGSIIENKLVSAQTVLEMLSWSYLVIHTGELSKTQFKKKNTASNNIRILLKKFQIGVNYSFIPELQTVEFDDGVHLLIAARNDVIHPLVNEGFDGNQKYMILQIGLYYIELVLLGILRFDKYYVNRLKIPLWEGSCEIVPWVQIDNKEESEN